MYAIRSYYEGACDSQQHAGAVAVEIPVRSIAGVLGLGSAVDLRPQGGEPRIEIGECGRLLPHPLHGDRLRAVGQEPGRGPQGHEAMPVV